MIIPLSYKYSIKKILISNQHQQWETNLKPAFHTTNLINVINEVKINYRNKSEIYPLENNSKINLMHYYTRFPSSQSGRLITFPNLLWASVSHYGLSGIFEAKYRIICSFKIIMTKGYLAQPIVLRTQREGVFCNQGNLVSIKSSENLFLLKFSVRTWIYVKLLGWTRTKR